MKLLLTGASGFLGQRLVERLKARAGYELYALARSSDAATALERMGVLPVRGDLTDAPALRSALDVLRPEAVIHLAAEIATQRSKRKLWAANHQGTKNLYDALRGVPLKRFLFASTVVVGDAHGEILTEDRPLTVQTEYGRTKQASEQMLLGAFQTEAFPAIVLRPSHIYGPGGWFMQLMRDLRRGLFMIPGDGMNLWDVVHVDDVAEAFVKVLETGVPGQVYHIVDDSPVTMNDFFQEAARHIGRKKVGHAPVFLAQLLRGKDPVLAATRSARSSNAKLKSLGWRPQYADYRAGLKQVFAK